MSSYMKLGPVVLEMSFKEKVYGHGQRPITIAHLELKNQCKTKDKFTRYPLSKVS